MAGHTAADSQNTLSALHAGNIFRRSFQTDKHNLLTASSPGFGILCSENNLAAGSARRCTQSLANGLSFLQCCSVKLRMQQSIQVSRIDHGNGLFFRPHTFVHQIAGDLQSRLSRTLTVSALQHVEFAVFHGKFHILHIAVMLFQNIADFHKVGVRFREFLRHLGNRHRRTHTCYNVFALRIGKEFAHQLLFAGRRITSKGNARAGVFVQIAENHGHHVDSGTPAVRNIVVPAIHVSTRVIPAAEYGFDGAHQLLFGIRGEIRTNFTLILGFEGTRQFFQVSGIQLDIQLDALFLLHFINQLLEVLFPDFHNDVRVHLDKTPIAVVYEAFEFRIWIAGNHRSNYIVIQTQIQNSVHHARHGSPCSGANRNKQRVLQISELFAVDLFHLSDVFHDLRLDFIVDLTAILIVLSAGFCRNGEALGNRQADICHFSQIGALAAQQLTHVGVAFSEEVQVLLGHGNLLLNQI